jgi:hypothetical protein
MIIDGLISIDDCLMIENEFLLSNKYLDKQVRGSELTTLILSTDILNNIKSVAESLANRKLETSDIYIRKTYKNQILHKHKDKCQYYFSIMLNQSDDNPNPLLIYYSDIPTEIILNRGSGIFFEGRKYYHERPPMKSDWYIGLYVGFHDMCNKLI